MKHHKVFLRCWVLAVMSLGHGVVHAATGINLVKQLAGQQVAGSNQQGASAQARPVVATGSVAQVAGTKSNIDAIGSSGGFVPVTANADPNNPQSIAKSRSANPKAGLTPQVPQFKFAGVANTPKQRSTGSSSPRAASRGLLVSASPEPVYFDDAADDDASDQDDDVAVDQADQDDVQVPDVAASVARDLPKNTGESNVAKHGAKAAKKHKVKGPKKPKAHGARASSKKSSRSGVKRAHVRQVVVGADYRAKLIAQAKAAAKKRAVAKSVMKKHASRRGKKLPHIVKPKVKAKSIADALRKERIARQKKKLTFVPDPSFGKHDHRKESTAAPVTKRPTVKAGGKFAALKEQLDAGKQYQGK